MRKYHKRETARGNHSLQGVNSAVVTVPDLRSFWTVNVQTTRTYDARFGILYEPDALSRSMAQLGLTRPLSTAWELVPWSFVADWVFEFGKYLDAIQPAGLTKTLCAWGSTRDTIVKTASVIGRTVTSPDPVRETFVASWSGGSTITSTVKSRYIWEPSIPLRPAFGSGLSQLRSADLAALTLQAIRTRF
jgi:hypothetical protein